MKETQSPRRWKVKTSAYFGTPGKEDATNEVDRKKFTLEGGNKTALGDRVGLGDIAVPSNVPLGTVFYVPGYGWGVARDHGAAIKGNRIDLATGGVVNGKINPNAEKAANQWGKKDQTVYVFPKGFQIPKDRKPPQEFLQDQGEETKPVINANADTPQITPQLPINVYPAPVVANAQPQPPMQVAEQPMQPEPVQPQQQQLVQPSNLSRMVTADASRVDPFAEINNVVANNRAVQQGRQMSMASLLNLLGQRNSA